MNMNMISLVAAMQVRNKEGGDQIANSMMMSAFLPNEMSALAPLLMMQSVTGTMDETVQAKANQIATQAKLEASNKLLNDAAQFVRKNKSNAAFTEFASDFLINAEKLGVLALDKTSAL